MKKSIFIFCFLIISSFNHFAFTQTYFNVVLPSDRNYVDGVYHPLIELFKDSLLIFTTTAYARKYGGTERVSILDRNGNLFYKSVLLDSVNPVTILDAKKLDQSILLAGTRFINSDTFENFWYAELNFKLDTIWTKEFKTNYNRCYVQKILPLNGGRIAYCGGKDQRRPNSSASLTSHGVVAITDNVGNLIHFIEVNDFDTTALEGYYGLTADKDENIYACGIVKKSGFNHDAVIVKVSPNGKLIWRRQIPSPDHNEVLNSIFPQHDGNILLIGASANGDFFADNFNTVLLINMRQDGIINWTKRIFWSWRSYNANCVSDTQGNIICGGVARFKDTDPYDGWICKFTPTGDSIWSRVISNTERTEQFFNISKASDGGFYLTGFSWIDSINTSKSWIVKVDSFGCLVPGCHKVVDTKDVSNGKIAFFEFFPNPARDVFYFLSRITENNNYQIKVIDLQGREVFKYSFQPDSGKQYVVEIPDQLSSGIYTLGVFDENGKMVQVEKMELH